MSRNIKFVYCGKSDIGRVRKNNEDANIALLVGEDDRYLICAAIDGVGGYEGGEVAAEITAETLAERMAVEAQKPEKLEADHLAYALAEANNRIVERRAADARLTEMGAVATAALFDRTKTEVAVAHVGDTRAYIYSEGELKKLTRDHSPVGELEDNGDISESEAMHHPHRNIIDRMLGEEAHTAIDKGFIDTIKVSYSLPAVFLLCSDGLTDMVESSFIRKILSDPKLNAEEKADELIAEANRIEGRDNITAVVVECFENEDPEITAPRIAVATKKADGLPAEVAEKEAQLGEDVQSAHKATSNRIILLLSVAVGVLAGFIAGFFTGVHFQAPNIVAEEVELHEEAAGGNDTIAVSTIPVAKDSLNKEEDGPEGE
ncbi:MAG: protein phosphatase 2C domain-containing protein [Muribaculaceae bacterium]|nr:protein phosphatase 2C domain-containing protein [Muribaculaceae bacterium]